MVEAASLIEFSDTEGRFAESLIRSVPCGRSNPWSYLLCIRCTGPKMPDAPHIHPVAQFLRRAGGILATFSAVLGLVSLRLGGTPEVVTQSAAVLTETNPSVIQSSRSAVTQTSIDALVSGLVQVAVAETHSLEPDDWQKLLASLASELHLGLTIEVQLPLTISEETPPADALSRLMWAKRLLQAYQIELKVEQEAIRLLPLTEASDSSLEARNSSKFGRRIAVSPLRTERNATITSFSSGEPRTILKVTESHLAQRSLLSVDIAHVQPTRTS